MKRMLPLAAPAADHESGGAGGVLPVELDAVALQKLRDLDPKGQHRVVERVMAAFDGSIARLLSQLDVALQADDLDGVRYVAHTLKSSSAAIGALTLSKICAEIESMARQGIVDGLDQRLSLMRADIARAQAAVRRFTGSQP